MIGFIPRIICRWLWCRSSVSPTVLAHRLEKALGFHSYFYSLIHFRVVGGSVSVWGWQGPASGQASLKEPQQPLSLWRTLGESAQLTHRLAGASPLMTRLQGLTQDILSWRNLCCGRCLVHCRMFNSIPGHYPLYTRPVPTKLWQPEMSSEAQSHTDPSPLLWELLVLPEWPLFAGGWAMERWVVYLEGTRGTG